MSFLLIKIGQSDENDVVLAHPSIAPEHAEIFVDVEGNVFLTDLNSGKDTFVNYQKLTDSIELKSMDKLTFGEGIELDWKAVLEINQPKTISVGRAKSNDFVIDAPSVSENHLQLIQDQNDSYFINDLSSEQGTYVNGNRISEIALLKAGDVVHVGDELFLWKSIFSSSETPTESEKPIEFVEVIEKSIDIPVTENELLEKIDVTPEPIDFVVEPEVFIVPEVVIIPEVMKSEPILEKPIQEKPTQERSIVDTAVDNSASEEKIKAKQQKKELIQLAIIVVANILMLILIASLI